MTKRKKAPILIGETRRWTPQEIEQLRALIAGGASQSAAGEKLDRTRESVAQLMSTLDFSEEYAARDRKRRSKMPPKISYADLACLPPLMVGADRMVAVYASTVFLIDLRRAGHTHGQGELRAEREHVLRLSAPYSMASTGSPAAQCAESCE